MNREELNWLLQTIQDAETAKRFILAQYKRGRIPFQLMADTARTDITRGTGLDQSHRDSIRDHDDPLLNPVRDDRICKLTLPDSSGRMSEQSSQNYAEAGRTQSTMASEEYGFLVAAKHGDLATFETLCKKSASTVLHIARRMTRSKEDAEDVLQESFQLAFMHFKGFKGDSRFSTWLSRIAVNASLMKMRGKDRLREVALDQSAETEELSFGHDVRDQGPNPEELYARKERRRILFEAMHELTPGMREAIELRELGERSTEQTAQIMGISASALKARVFHGRKILRERLKDHVGRALTSGKDTSRMIGNTRRVRSQGPVECNACD